MEAWPSYVMGPPRAVGGARDVLLTYSSCRVRLARPFLYHNQKLVKFIIKKKIYGTRTFAGAPSFLVTSSFLPFFATQSREAKREDTWHAQCRQWIAQPNYPSERTRMRLLSRTSHHGRQRPRTKTARQLIACAMELAGLRGRSLSRNEMINTAGHPVVDHPLK